ncbi:lipid-A-disaccharide synthase [Candidatus Babeliales bacterium]|nr:lipid-A-disaccharide synthase [Candidatus Babeliales bacterium]
MKKIFIVAGELSGDKTGAWYVNRLSERDVYLEAVGGNYLQQAGAHLYERFEALNVVGIVEIVRHLRRLLSFLKKLANHIIEQNFDEVVLVDFPGFNLRLAQALKKRCPDVKITYLSPPQLWCWGAWRIKTIRQYCDRVIVLYPFEVAWYGARGVQAEWLGCPVYDRVQPYFENMRTKQPKVALIAGSRPSELATLFPVVADVAARLAQEFPELKFVIPQAESLDINEVRCALATSALRNYQYRVEIVSGAQSLAALSSCSLAISKPGTITLELALLNIPTVVLFKISWLSYWLGRMVVNIKNMALPNLLSTDVVCKEFIQQDCQPAVIAQYAAHLYKKSVRSNYAHPQHDQLFTALRAQLTPPQS